MIKYLVKRDGQTVVFNPDNIKNAINKAIQANPEIEVSKTLADDIALAVSSHIYTEYIDIEQVQNLVETELMKRNPELAKKYILYREKRSAARKRKEYKVTMSIVEAESNDITKENANMNAETPAGMMMKFASESSKQFTYDMLLSDKTKDYMARNLIYPHDLDYYPTKSLTCLHHPMDKILSEGFKAGHGSSRPAKRIETAAILTCISLEIIQNEMHGGQAIPAFDFYLAPFVKMTLKEELKKVKYIDKSISYEQLEEAAFDEIERVGDYIYDNVDEWGAFHSNLELMVQLAINGTVNRVHQALESYIHNMNTIHSRGGNQVVFSSINYGTDTSPEGRCIIRETLITTYQGVGNGETPIFPIQIWKKKRGVSYLPTDRNYDLYKLACKVTAKRFYPNFLNLDATFNQDEAWKADDPRRFEHEVATMGCRTRVYEDRHGQKTSVGRGNLSFTTINLPKIAMLAAKNAKDDDKKLVDFFNLLNEAIDAAADQLYDRFKLQCTAAKKQFPLLMSGMWMESKDLDMEDKIADVIKHGTLGVGFIGLAEALIVLTGKHHGESEEAQELGLEIISHMSEYIKAIGDEKNLNYSLLATPAEGLSGKFIKKDKEEFGLIENVTDKEYYTNSSHVPVWYKCSAEHKAKIEGPYHEYERGGHIFYVEFDGDATHNIEAIMQTVDLIDKYNIGYGAINHLRNRCLDCGHEDSDENVTVCPDCGSENIDTIQRITGYLVGSISRWNSAKKAELRDRVTHSN